MTTTTPFTIGDPVQVRPGIPAAKDLEGRIGTVIGFEQADRTWVVVLFDRMFSGRADRGWLFSADTLVHVDQTQAAA